MYSESERLIFGPFDRGDGVNVFADPLAAYRVLVLDLHGEHNQLLADLSDEVEEKRLAAEAELVPATRRALGLLYFNAEEGTGATDQQVLALLQQFAEWFASKKQQAAS